MAPKTASSRTRRSAVPLALLVASLVRPAGAQSANTASSAPNENATERAQRLFDEARVLMKAERYPEACEKLAESQTLDPGGGTLLNLGICRLKEGRTATAFRLLSDALEQARAAGRADRITTAERHLAEVKPLLSRLVLEPPPNGLPEGTVVAIDDAALASNTPNEPLWLDPGDHTVHVSRPGYVGFDTRVTLGPKADVVRLAIPELSPAAPETPSVAMPALPPPTETRTEPAQPSPAVPAPEHSRPPPVAYALLAGGGVALVVGSYFGAQAFSNKHDSNRYFNGTHCTQQSCVDDWDQAKTAALASDIALGVGVVAAGAGLYLLLARPEPHASASTGVRLSFGASRSAGFARASGSF